MTPDENIITGIRIDHLGGGGPRVSLTPSMVARWTPSMLRETFSRAAYPSGPEPCPGHRRLASRIAVSLPNRAPTFLRRYRGRRYYKLYGRRWNDRARLGVETSSTVQQHLEISYDEPNVSRKKTLAPRSVINADAYSAFRSLSIVPSRLREK